VTIFQLIHD